MATDPPAAPPLPEIADLDPAFDLTTFATERSAVRPARPARASVEVRPALDRYAPAGIAQAEIDDLHRGGWLSDSAIQVGIALLLVFGAVAIVILAVRGRQTPPTPAPTHQVHQAPPAPAVAVAERPAPAPASPPSSPPPKTAATRSRESDAGPAPVRPRRTAAAAVSRSGTPARLPAPAPRLRGTASSRTPPAAAPTVIQHARLNVNASPWANVWLDGRPIGETPLANLRVPAGEHELIFRHPDLGERRVLAVVEAGGTTRVTVDLRE